MNRAATPQPDVWNADRIREELRKRHLTLTGVARAAGLPEDACRKAMYGYSRRGADALAKALDIPFDTLFPTGFVQSRRQASVKALAESRQKRGSAPDSARARA